MQKTHLLSVSGTKTTSTYAQSIAHTRRTTQLIPSFSLSLFLYSQCGRAAGLGMQFLLLLLLLTEILSPSLQVPEGEETFLHMHVVYFCAKLFAFDPRSLRRLRRHPDVCLMPPGQQQQQRQYGVHKRRYKRWKICLLPLCRGSGKKGPE